MVILFGKNGCMRQIGTESFYPDDLLLCLTTMMWWILAAMKKLVTLHRNWSICLRAEQQFLRYFAHTVKNTLYLRFVCRTHGILWYASLMVTYSQITVKGGQRHHCLRGVQRAIHQMLSD